MTLDVVEVTISKEGKIKTQWCNIIDLKIIKDDMDPTWAIKLRGNDDS